MQRYIALNLGRASCSAFFSGPSSECKAGSSLCGIMARNMWFQTEKETSFRDHRMGRATVSMWPGREVSGPGVASVLIKLSIRIRVVYRAVHRHRHRTEPPPPSVYRAATAIAAAAVAPPPLLGGVRAQRP